MGILGWGQAAVLKAWTVADGFSRSLLADVNGSDPGFAASESETVSNASPSISSPDYG